MCAVLPDIKFSFPLGADQPAEAELTKFKYQIGLTFSTASFRKAFGPVSGQRQPKNLRQKVYQFNVLKIRGKAGDRRTMTFPSRNLGMSAARRSQVQLGNGSKRG
jgi:hypothetical protein